MSESTAIEWTDSTWTPVRARHIELQNDGSGKERIGWHCEHESPGCINCYSEAFNKRLGTGREFKPVHLVHRTAHGDQRGDVSLFLDERVLLAPLRWRRPRMIFACSMTDLFAAFVQQNWIDRVFAVMALAPRHTFQVLTKRAARMREYLSNPNVHDRIIGVAREMLGQLPTYKHEGILERPWPLPNVWAMVSAEDQRRADERVPELHETPAAVRGLSVEPMLGPIDLGAWLWVCCGNMMPGNDHGLLGQEPDHCCGKPEPLDVLDLVIAGGESGPRARSADLAWFRSLRDQCHAAGVAYFQKQITERGRKLPIEKWPDDLRVREMPNG